MEEKNNFRLTVRSFLILIKLRLSLAIAFSAITGWLLLPGDPGVRFLLLCSGIFFLTAGSAVLNQYTERELDARMARTNRRPIVTREISGTFAIIILTILITAGSLLLFVLGPVPFMLGLSGIFFYNFLYTYLKKVSFLAIFPGALVGSIPPLIGYSSAGGDISDERILFFSAFMFLWQVPHFLLLLIRYGREYRDAGFRTLYDFAGIRLISKITLVWIIVSSIGLVSYLFLLSGLSLLFSSLFLTITVIYILLMIRGILSLNTSGDQRKVFMLFNLYSFLVMVLLAVMSITTNL